MFSIYLFYIFLYLILRLCNVSKRTYFLKANVVAQTRIQYNEQQLNQLIYQHLMSKGLTETANILHREANLESSAIMRSATTYQPFTYRNPASVTVS